MKVKLLAGRTTARFVIYNPAPEDTNPGESDPDMEGAIVYLPKKAARTMAAPGHDFPEYLYLDVQAG